MHYNYGIIWYISNYYAASSYFYIITYCYIVYDFCSSTNKNIVFLLLETMFCCTIFSYSNSFREKAADRSMREIDCSVNLTNYWKERGVKMFIEFV